MERTTAKQRTVYGTCYGTCYFPTYSQALDYYAAYESRPAQTVQAKLKEGSICIGKPKVKAGQRLFVRDNRWHVEEVAPFVVSRLPSGLGLTT